MKSEPTIGSPPMPTMVELPTPGLLQLVADLVGERPRPRDDADAPWSKNCAGMIPTFAFPGESTPGQLGPISRTPAFCLPVDAQHVVDRDPSVIAITVCMPASIAS